MYKCSKENETPTNVYEVSFLTREENEYVEFKVSKLENKIVSMKTRMEKKVGILNMVSKIKFQNFKYGIKLNMARKYVLKEIESKHYLK
jgi:hypothetical protein